MKLFQFLPSFAMVSTILVSATVDDELNKAASLFIGPVEVVVQDERIVWPESPTLCESKKFLLFSDVKWTDPDTGLACGMLWKYDLLTDELIEFLKCSGLVGPEGPDAVDGLPADIDRLVEAGSNGLKWGWENGTLLMNQHGWKRIVEIKIEDIDDETSSIDPSLVKIVADTYNGTNLNSPNDLDLSLTDGYLYFSDPPFAHQYKDVEDPFGYSFEVMTQDAPAVYRINNEPGAVPERLLEYDVPEDYAKRYGPNGIAVVDANGDLVVALTDFSNPRTNVYARKEDGTFDTEPKKVLIHDYRIEGENSDKGWPALVDGITYDSNTGKLFINGPGGVYIYDPNADYEFLGFIRTDDLCSNNSVNGGYLWITCFTRGILRVPIISASATSTLPDVAEPKSSELGVDASSAVSSPSTSVGILSLIMALSAIILL